MDNLILGCDSRPGDTLEVLMDAKEVCLVTRLKDDTYGDGSVLLEDRAKVEALRDKLTEWLEATK